MTNSLSFLATCPVGLGTLLIDELTDLGAQDLRETPAGVYFNGPLAVAYRACLWSRLANRILLKLSDTAVAGTDDVYSAVRGLRWSDHMTQSTRFAVEFRGQTSYIKNTHFGALKIKDGIVDFFRDHSGQRPSVDAKRPDLRIVAQLSKGKLAISIDLSGDSLHRRGYRLDGGKAPLKENLAAGILVRSGWAKRVGHGESLIDPMCGSGTLLIEAAMIALNKLPDFIANALVLWVGSGIVRNSGGRSWPRQDRMHAQHYPRVSRSGVMTLIWALYAGQRKTHGGCNWGRACGFD